MIEPIKPTEPRKPIITLFFKNKDGEVITIKSDGCQPIKPVDEDKKLDIIGQEYLIVISMSDVQNYYFSFFGGVKRPVAETAEDIVKEIEEDEG